MAYKQRAEADEGVSHRSCAGSTLHAVGAASQRLSGQRVPGLSEVIPGPEVTVRGRGGTEWCSCAEKGMKKGRGVMWGLQGHLMALPSYLSDMVVRQIDSKTDR